MKIVSALRSTSIAASLLIAALASCSSGGSGNGDGGTSPGGGGSSGGAASACPAPGSNTISDLEQPAQWAWWSTSHDTTVGGMQTPAGAFAAEQLPDTHYAVHTSGTGFTTWGAGVALNPAAARKCLDFSKYTGITFRAKGPANLIVAAQVPGVIPTTEGGTCATNCYDSHKTTVSVGADFAQYTLFWNQFVQAGWGTHVDFQGSALSALSFTVGPGDMPFNFWIDDVAFTDAAPPSTGAGGAPSAGGSSAGGAPGAAGSTSNGGSGGNGGSAGAVVVPTRDFSQVLTEAQFNQMFPNRNGFYTWAGLAAAAAKFPLFASVGDVDTQKREVAALLANAAHETSYLQAINEQAGGAYCDATNVYYKCAPGQQYYGRGPLQISWNYNYGSAGAALKEDLLANPGLVASDSTIAWETALWFWMTIAANNYTAHTAITKNAGFGQTISIINGNIECNGKRPDSVSDRVNAYTKFCALLGVAPGDNLSC